MKGQNIKEQIEDMIKQPQLGKRIEIVRLQMVKEGRCLYEGKQLSDARTAAEFIKPIFSMADREMVVVVSLDTKLQPLAVEIVAMGGLDFCNVDIRSIFKHSLLNNASSIICFHNHPSGDPESSIADQILTKRIRTAGEFLAIPLIDHIILGDDCFYSFKEERILV